MPQLQLVEVGPSQMRDLRITVSPPNKIRQATQVVVAVERGNQTAPFPCWVGTLPGLEVDLLQTMVTEALTARAEDEAGGDECDGVLTARVRSGKPPGVVPHPLAVPRERLVLVGWERGGNGQDLEVFVQFRPGVRGGERDRDRRLL